MTTGYDRWLMRDPEDDLPAWVFEMEDCPNCSEVVRDSVPYHVQHGDFGGLDWIEFCKCEEEE